MDWSVCEVLVEDALISCVGCTVAATNLQPKPNAKPETAVSAKVIEDEVAGCESLLLI